MVVRLVSNFKIWLVENSSSSLFSLPFYFACNFMDEEEKCYRKQLWKEWGGAINTKETSTILDLAKNVKPSLLSLFPVDGWKHGYLPQFPDEP